MATGAPGTWPKISPKYIFFCSLHPSASFIMELAIICKVRTKVPRIMKHFAWDNAGGGKRFTQVGKDFAATEEWQDFLLFFVLLEVGG